MPYASNWCAAGAVPNESLFYYKTRKKKEVDFILREGDKGPRLDTGMPATLMPKARAKREHGALIEAGKS